MTFDFGLILLLSALLLLAVAVYLFVSTILNMNSDQAGLALAEESEQHKAIPLIHFSKPLVQNLTIQQTKYVKSKQYRQNVQKKIVFAGLAKELTVDEFIGLQILWGVMFPLGALILNFALQIGYPFYVFIIVGALGAFFPHIYCKTLSQKKVLSVEKELPFFIDLLALSTEAGLDLVASIQKITEKASAQSILAQEFHTVLKEITLGSSRKEAFGNLQKRIDSKEIQSFAITIQDADETGASVAQTLKAKSEQMRYERFNKAEQAGAKASQKILIPMIMFVLPAVFIAVFAPIALSFYYKKGG